MWIELKGRSKATHVEETYNNGTYKRLGKLDCKGEERQQGH